jgi:ABC-type uncharacterized transport system ATPase component
MCLVGLEHTAALVTIQSNVKSVRLNKVVSENNVKTFMVAVSMLKYCIN